MHFPLNPPQREAVRHIDGPLLVLAGAGSGKTRVITAKIAHLIEHGVDPSRIVAITFTNKAAREMRERAQALLKAQGKAGEAAKVIIATFHALGPQDPAQRSEGGGIEAGLLDLRSRRTWNPSSPNSSPPVRSRPRARGAVEDQRVEERAGAAGGRAQGGAAVTTSSSPRARMPTMARRWPRTRRWTSTTSSCAWWNCSSATRTSRARWQAKCAHVLVDEYQDTNPAQYRLLRALVGATTPFTAVGDDDQAIYGWRGATIDNLASLPRDYPGPQGRQARAELPVHRAHPALARMR